MDCEAVEKILKIKLPRKYLLSLLPVCDEVFFLTASVRPLWSDSGDDRGVRRRTSRVFSSHHAAPIPSLPSYWDS